MDAKPFAKPRTAVPPAQPDLPGRRDAAAEREVSFTRFSKAGSNVVENADAMLMESSPRRTSAGRS
jgi:hypothetical protein